MVNDTVFSGAGEDYIEVSGTGNVTINTGDGSDEIVVKAGTLGSIDITKEELTTPLRLNLYRIWKLHVLYS